jgi:hypothetical protein
MLHPETASLWFRFLLATRLEGPCCTSHHRKQLTDQKGPCCKSLFLRSQLPGLSASLIRAWGCNASHLAILLDSSWHTQGQATSFACYLAD